VTQKRIFLVSLIVFGLSVCGILGFLFVCFAFFAYQGNGMDWIYTTGGFFVLVALGSGFMTIINGIRTIKEHIQSKGNRESSD